MTLIGVILYEESKFRILDSKIIQNYAFMDQKRACKLLECEIWIPRIKFPIWSFPGKNFKNFLKIFFISRTVANSSQFRDLLGVLLYVKSKSDVIFERNNFLDPFF